MQNLRRVLLLGLVLSNSILADTKPKSKDEISQELISKFVKASCISETIEQIFFASISTRQISDSDTKSISLVSKKLGNFFESERFMRKLKDTYAQHFSAAELQEIINFYDSAAGSKFLKLAPQIGNDLIVNLLPDLQALSEELAIELSQIQPETESGF